MRLVDVVIAYLYRSLDSDIYMKIPERFKMSEALSSKPKKRYLIRLQRSLYGLKQFRRIWYNNLSEYLLKKEYVNNSICPFVFRKKTIFGSRLIAIYIDDLPSLGLMKKSKKWYYT